MGPLKLGIDLGSTTAKMVILDDGANIIYSDYIRHNTQIQETLIYQLKDIHRQLGNVELQVAFSGSAAMGIAEKTNLLFVQEIIAASNHVKRAYPLVKSLIDIGGEDAKLILFSDTLTPDIRMNGNCAGGTGAYIDQMAVLIGVSIEKLNDLAWESTKTYPIASRCGVFAKTDVQNLISRKIEMTDIAASIFEAVASQIISTLARGSAIMPQILFSGGPLTYISYLRKAFAKLLNLDKAEIIVPDYAELFTAIGAAGSIVDDKKPVGITDFIDLVKSSFKPVVSVNSLTPLFADFKAFEGWEKKRNLIKIPETKIKRGDKLFLGIDSGSTTTKVVLLNEKSELVFEYYKNNLGKPLETVIDGLKLFLEKNTSLINEITIAKSAVTGYGEELIRSALCIDYGIVETVSHFLAAQNVEPAVSFILDIGGQDIKAITVQSHTISKIEINEACSSGCGSFIEGFAHTLGYTPGKFAMLGTKSKAPYDLGSRCTVFMNSKVKQALREGATVPDLSAGLAYSVIRNSLNKVLRIKSSAEIGENIVVQGGTFKNQAVLRSLELLTGKKISISDKPELMGAYGAALYAMVHHELDEQPGSFVGFNKLYQIADFKTRLSVCKGCTNNCTITIYAFASGGKCYSGNKCEKIFSNNSKSVVRGKNIFDFKRELIFSQNNLYNNEKIKIGIPRVLNMYENFPFWYSLFTRCGLQVEVSDTSSFNLYKKGIGNIMSDNVCFPAKLSHGHIINLMHRKVDRIFLPLVIYEKLEFKKSSNSYNCPIVTGYPEVLKNTSHLAGNEPIPFDTPAINFNDNNLLKKACWEYLNQFQVDKTVFNAAFVNAQKAQEDFKLQLKQHNYNILNDAIRSDHLVVMIASHPYHMDYLVHQQVSQLLSDLGVSVINEDIIYSEEQEGFESFLSISQWGYPNRILQAAWWASRQKFPLGLIQLNSFGCGPDSFIMDEINDLAKKANLSFALIRIDEISSPGSIKLRLRSLVESLKLKQQKYNYTEPTKSKQQAVFDKKDITRTLLVPWFSDFYSPFIPGLGKILGYRVENIPPSDPNSVELGLEYANNEICYPATLVVGDVIRTLKSGKYNSENIAIGISQTGGQCRATNYLSLIKKAMISAGFSDIPVVAIAPADSMFNIQPGFTPSWLKVLKPAFGTLLFADCLSRLYYPTAARELIPGSAKRLRDKYLDFATKVLSANPIKALNRLLREAVKEFNNLPASDAITKTVGLVGEIYIKYNSFGQSNIIDWLIENRIEVALPPLMEFFTQSFINTKARVKEFIANPEKFDILGLYLKYRANAYLYKFEEILKGFRFYRPAHTIDYSAQLAGDILNLNHQYGEGWLIPAEVASFARQNINQVICIQPFGCIANHVVGKGMELKIKSLYPNMNLLFIDFDSGISKVNILNRLHFLIQNMV